MSKSLSYLPLLLGFVLFSGGCKVNFSFTGASIPPEVKTVSIQYFPNRAELVNPSLSPSLVEMLKDRFLRETNLALVSQNGDMDFQGAVTAYSVIPVAIQGNETAAMNRLTVSVKVKFTNAKEEKQNFDEVFSRYEDFDSQLGLSAVEDQLVRSINEQLVEAIFNRAVANW